VFAPGDAIPGVSGDIFLWGRGDSNSTFSAWDTFEAVLPPNFVATNAGAGFTDSTPDAGLFGNASSISVGAGIGFPLSSGNAYSPFVPLGFSASVSSGTTGGAFTRIVAQMETLGNILDDSSILLTLGNGTNLAPSLLLKTQGLPPNPNGGGAGTDYLALWDINGSADSYDLAFNAAGSSLSLSQFQLDSFVQSSAFSTPTVTAVPEPSSFALMAVGAFGLVWRRKRQKLAR